jgi:ATP phosphoribosyltransferase regulatory subunit
VLRLPSLNPPRVPLVMPPKAAIRAEGERLLAAFVAAGAVPVETDVLQPAGTLLDLYGEDIRARAYVTDDPLQGEMMLRPDFTVPVVQAHMAHGADPARYAYLGEVFRKQMRGSGRASEYLQVGYEVFDRSSPEVADAEVFALFRDLLADLNLRPVTGDVGILMAAVRGLDTTERRKTALLRHIWRPARFRSLLDRFAGRAPVPVGRLRLLERLATGTPAALIEEAGTFVGLRSADEITARAEALVADAATPPIKATEAALLYDLLGLEAPAAAALTHLRGITPSCPQSPGGRPFRRPAGSLDARGGCLHPRLRGEPRADQPGILRRLRLQLPRPEGLPPVASGGRYDALTAVLGQGASIPAVGGVIRPGLVARLKGAS